MAMLVKGLLLLLLVWGWLLPVTAQATSLSSSESPILMAMDLSGSELADFARAYQATQELRVKAEADMVKAVEAAGLTVAEFNETARSTSDLPAVAPAPQFAPTLETILAIRQKAEIAMEEAIQSTGLELEQFNQILQQSAQDPDLQKRISVLLQKS